MSDGFVDGFREEAGSVCGDVVVENAPRRVAAAAGSRAVLASVGHSPAPARRATEKIFCV
jgi:hypothetical protein